MSDDHDRDPDQDLPDFDPGLNLDLGPGQDQDQDLDQDQDRHKTPAGPRVLCPCGQPLHYRDELWLAYMTSVVRRLGWFIVVNVPASGNESSGYRFRRFRVPRHWIVLHGFDSTKIQELFKEIPV